MTGGGATRVAVSGATGEGMRTACVKRRKPGFANKALRAIWKLAWLVLYRPSPRPFHGWRRFVLRCFGARIGRGAKPYPDARIWAPWNLVMGEGSVLGDGVDCYCVDRISLGPRAVVSQRSFLCSASHDFDRPGFALTSAPVVIGEDAWVAAESFVGPGVTLGKGAVMLARAVAVRDVPAMTVVAGNPVRIVRHRSPAGTAPIADAARSSGRRSHGLL